MDSTEITVFRPDRTFMILDERDDSRRDRAGRRFRSVCFAILSANSTR